MRAIALALGGRSIAASAFRLGPSRPGGAVRFHLHRQPRHLYRAGDWHLRDPPSEHHLVHFPKCAICSYTTFSAGRKKNADE